VTAPYQYPSRMSESVTVAVRKQNASSAPPLLGVCVEE
jgi:hypothetical protein